MAFFQPGLRQRARGRDDFLDRMTVTVLGSGTCVPLPARAASGYLVRIGENPILVDAGPGTLTRLAAAGVSYTDLDLVLVSHLHPDHTLDLATLLQASNATPGFQRSRSLTIVGCRGISSFLSRLFEIYDGIAPEGYSLHVLEMEEEAASHPPGWTLTSGFSGHTPTSLCYRFEWGGRILAYSGDASAAGNLARIARGADLLLCECSLPAGWSTPDHLNAGQVGAIAREADVDHVVLTHLYPPSLEADVAAQVRASYAGQVTLASDGWTAPV
jgi:ribonuclease BN (tRNA processing enzyme)